MLQPMTQKTWIKFVKEKLNETKRLRLFEKIKICLLQPMLPSIKISSKHMNVYTQFYLRPMALKLNILHLLVYDFYRSQWFPTEFEIMKNDFNTFLNAYLKCFILILKLIIIPKNKSLEKDKSNIIKKNCKTQDKSSCL